MICNACQNPTNIVYLSRKWNISKAQCPPYAEFHCKNPECTNRVTLVVYAQSYKIRNYKIHLPYNYLLTGSKVYNFTRLFECPQYNGTLKYKEILKCPFINFDINNYQTEILNIFNKLIKLAVFS